MSILERSQTAEQAIAVLRENGRGTHTVPTKGLYPFQWKWDSCFTALGPSHDDLDRAWTEIETLFAHQWDDGMVPHMVFHEPAPTLLSRMGAEGADSLVSEDHVHPNDRGHAKIAEIFADATRPGDP